MLQNLLLFSQQLEPQTSDTFIIHGRCILEAVSNNPRVLIPRGTV